MTAFMPAARLHALLLGNEIRSAGLAQTHRA
jgi:hypothetical protein